MTRTPKPILEALAGREDLVTGILEVLDRT